MDTQTAMIRIGGKTRLGPYVRSVWERRQFAVAVASGELRSKNMNTVLGNLWHVLNPLMLVGVYYLVFGVLIPRELMGGGDNYVAFLVVGIFHYHYSQKSVMSGAKSISSNEGLIRSIQFPRAILPISVVIGQALAFIPALGIMLILSIATGERPAPLWLLLVPLFVLQSLWNVGGAFFLARLTDRFRDIQQVLPYLFRLAFYLSGVIYSVDRFVPAEYQIFWDLNPFYVFLTIARDLVMHNTFTPHLWASASAWTVVMLAVGFLFFRNAEHEYGRG